jgi:hypothetical protein
MQLALPYALSLVPPLPFIILGVISLSNNGVSAAGGRFIRVRMITTGSQMLTEVATGGYLHFFLTHRQLGGPVAGLYSM